MKDCITETIGCDLGDKESEVWISRSDGTSSRHKVKTTPAAMKKFFTRAPSDVFVEAGAQSRWVSKVLQELGHRVTVANPRRLKLISQSDSKSDRTDAELLTRLGKADRTLLAPIEHRNDEAHGDLAIAKARDLLVRCRTQLVNHVRGVMKSLGEALPKCEAEVFHRKTKDLVPKALQPALQPVYRTLAELDEQIKRHDRTLVRTAKKYPDVEILSQPHGVGVLTAFVFMLTLGDKKRFKQSRQAGAYIGLRPRKSQSGDDDPQLQITKAGNPFLRRLLVNSANHILGPFGKDSDLRRWGLAIAQRGGKNARKRAKVAVARKLAVLMHRLWVTGEMYEPLGYRERRMTTT